MKKWTAIVLFFICVLYVSGQTQNMFLLKFPQESRNDSPTLTFAEDGILWAAWSSLQDNRFRLAVSKRIDDRWSKIENPDISPADQREPVLVRSSGGGIHLVYTAFDKNQWSIRQVSHDGRRWNKPRILGSGIKPTATSAGGKIWIAWEEGRNIAVRVWDPGADPEQALTEMEIKSEDSFDAYGQPCLESGHAGEVWLAWTGSRRDYQSVLLQRLDVKGSATVTIDEGSGVNREPRISVDRQGRVWVVYEALELDKLMSRGILAQKKATSGYLLDYGYTVESPSKVVWVTDGKNWWKPRLPDNPALGFTPNIFCSRSGTVWLLSRAFTGFTWPFRFFYPLCESYGGGGWKNHDEVWPQQKGYKSVLPMAEDKTGNVWTVWIQHYRETLGAKHTPSWTILDAHDALVLGKLPTRPAASAPVLIPVDRPKPTVAESVVSPRFVSQYKGEDLKVYFGDLHQHSEFSSCGRLNGWVDQNQRYTRYIRGLDFVCTIDHAEHLNDHNWRTLQLTAERNNVPGEFVTFSGFEWTSEFDAGGNHYYGHYNAIFRDVGKGDYYFSASDPRTNSPLELWDALKKYAGGADNVLTFPHHSSRRVAWLSWNYYDPQMVPLIEIAQSRGSYEYDGCFSDQLLANADCARVRGHYIHDGLARGMRWGFVASGDHGGRQLAAVFSESLNRDDLFDSFKARRTYATNGAKMFLDIRINDHFMGEEFVLDTEKREIKFKATGTSPIIQIELFRNGRVIRQWNMQDLNFEHVFTDQEPLYGRENYYYLRAIQMDGGQAWSSPIWVINPNIPGQFRFNVGGDELRVIYPEADTEISILVHNETKETLEGKSFLRVPETWNLKEEKGLEFSCPPGAWQHIVFHVKAPANSIPSIALPPVTAHFELGDGRTGEDTLFVVSSPTQISREKKADLIDARTELFSEEFRDYLRWMEEQRLKALSLNK